MSNKIYSSFLVTVQTLCVNSSCFQQTLFLRLGIVGELAPTTVEAAERMDLKQGGVGVVEGDKTGGRPHTWFK